MTAKECAGCEYFEWVYTPEGIKGPSCNGPRPKGMDGRDVDKCPKGRDSKDLTKKNESEVQNERY